MDTSQSMYHTSAVTGGFKLVGQPPYRPDLAPSAQIVSTAKSILVRKNISFRQ